MSIIDRHLVVVSRKWHEPFIRVSLTDTDIKIIMSLDDFAQAVAHEIGADPVIVSTTFDKVVQSMKRESAKAM